MHSFALTIAVFFAISVYEIMLKWFGEMISLLTLLALLSNVSFFAVSSFLLTDVAFTLSVFGVIYCYIEEKYLLTALFLILTGYIKESGMVLFPLLAFDIFLKLVEGNFGWKKARSWIVTLVVSMCVIVAFFVEQKRTLGWYFFPLHIGLINTSIDSTFKTAHKLLAFIFFYYNNYLSYGLIGIFCVVISINKRNLRYTIIPALFLAICLCCTLLSSKDAVFFLLIAILFITAIWVAKNKFTEFNARQISFIRLSLMFGLLYGYFCCVNCFAARYLLPIVFFISIALFSILSAKLIKQTSTKLWPFFIVAITVFGVFNIVTKEAEMDSFDRMNIQTEVVKYFEKNNLYDATIYCLFLDHLHLTDPNTGFRNTDKKFTNVLYAPNDSTQYYVFDDIGDIDYSLYAKIGVNPNYKIERRWVGSHSYDIVVIYKKIR